MRFINDALLFFFLFALIHIPASCTNDEMSGGPCTYNTEVLPAEVIAIAQMDSTSADLIFRVREEDGTIVKDSVSWYMQNNSRVPLEQIKKEGITIGSVCSFEIMTIVEGACNPYIQKLKLEIIK